MLNLAANFGLPGIQALLELGETELFRQQVVKPNCPGHKSNQKATACRSAIRSRQDVVNLAKGFQAKDTA